MQDSKQLIEQVEKIIPEVYLVGGSVRDIILERTPKDYDFTTPLSPDEVEAKVKAAGRHAYAIGKRFGTIGFKVADEAGKYQYVEVTTFRRETYQAGSRKPEVEFVTELKEDIARRDFTINAIALRDGEFFDPFGGRIDIMAKKIKAVGSAKDRFKEDPLRMLRAARFMAQLDFEIDPNLIGIMRKMGHAITTVSRERWTQELDKLLMADDAAKGIELLSDTYLLKYMLPELWMMARFYPFEWNMTLESVELTAGDADDKWGAFLKYAGTTYAKTVKNEKASYAHHNLIGAELAFDICARLKFSNKRTKTVLEIVEKST